MVKSMTGYGRSLLSLGKTNVSVEIRSVNHRFLDISLKIPRTLMFMEEQMKKIIRSNFHRGRIEVYLSLDGDDLIQHNLMVNWELMDQYITSFKEIKQRYNLEGNLPLEMITQMENIFTIEESEQTDDSIYQTIIEALNQACQQVTTMRQTEGKELIQDLIERMNFIQHTLKKLGDRRDVVIIEYRERIKQRIAEHLSGELANDESKIYQDIALLAEKGDITEEVTRLGSHITQFFETIKDGDVMGRKLDFIAQEMFREINTIGSKSNDARISEWIVTLKSEIEKVKEQIQNVE